MNLERQTEHRYIGQFLGRSVVVRRSLHSGWHAYVDGDRAASGKVDRYAATAAARAFIRRLEDT